jgi:NAD(P)H-flavin reductase
VYRDYFIATAAVYVPCYVYPWLRTCFEYGVRQKAQLSVEDNGFTRITIPAKFKWVPGQHCFLRFTSFGLLPAMSSHPFTICSLPSTQPDESSELVFYIRHEGGFTAKLNRHALENPEVPVPVLVDGPYGGINRQKYYEGDHALVISGGSGAGWCLPFVERFIRDSYTPACDEEQGKVASTKVKEKLPLDGPQGLKHSGPHSLRIVLATRDTSNRAWFLRTVDELLAKYPATDASSNIHIQVFRTGEAPEKAHVSHKEGSGHVTGSNGSTSSEENRATMKQAGKESTVPVQEFKNRPQLPQLIHDEAANVAEAGQSLVVFVCGPITMQNDVRNAVAQENLNILKGSKAGGVYLHSEHFSWA